MRYRLLSFRGDKGAGKTTAAQYLVDHYSFLRIAFSDALKIEVYDAMLDWNAFPNFADVRKSPALTNHKIVRSAFDAFVARSLDKLNPDAERSEKIDFVSQNKLELRSVLQWWGTEYRRAQNPTYWLDKFEETVHANGCRYIVVDDARFENEIDLVTDLNGVHVYIDTPAARELAAKRDGGKDNSLAGHASDALSDPLDPRHSMILRNDGTLKKFEGLIEGAVHFFHAA